MRKYDVTIKRIQVTTMTVGGNNAKEAIRKVENYVKKCEKNNVSLDKTLFNEFSVFRYKSKLIRNKNEKSQV